MVERVDGAGLADLSDLALRALAHPGAVESCEDTLEEATRRRMSHAGGSATGDRFLEVVVEALDLDEQAEGEPLV